MRKFVLSTLAVLASAVMALAQTLQVQGTVKDATGAPVPSATVSLNGAPSNYIVSDFNGAFSIKAPADGTLKVECYGYKTTLVPVAGRKSIDVVLEDALEQIEETIVVAFGTSSKEAFTGSAKVIGEDKLAQSQVSNVTSALAGQVAGVQLVSSNGAPGSSPVIRVRGISSINAGKDPLIIVDGTPYDGDLNNIAPSDIETMTVLKDAASNALYGARGANGVIMITTKKAKRGVANVTVDIKAGVNSTALQKYSTINDPRGYYEQHYKALYNYYTSEGIGLTPAEAHVMANENLFNAESGGLGYQVYTVPAGQQLIGKNGKVNPAATPGYVDGDFLITADNWDDYAYRNGARQEYTFTVSGAEEKLSYYSSISYLSNQGITEKSDHSRLTARLKADYQAKNWLKVGANMSYAKYEFNQLGNNGDSSSTANIWAFTSQIAPIYPLWVRNADGSIYTDDNGIQLMDHGNGILNQGGIPGTSRPFINNANPLLANKLNTRNSEGNALSTQGYVNIDICKGLTFTVNASSTVNETRSKVIYNPYYGQFRNSGGTIGIEHDRFYAFNSQQLINYTKTIDNHHINALLGHEYYDYKSYVLYADKTKMFSQENTELDGAVVDGQSATSSMGEYNNEGYFTRFQYDYSERIFGSLSYRRDASSRFHPDHRWGNFWSAGAAWVVSKENWYQIPWLNEFKVKASIGSQGNDNIGSYRYTDVYDIVPSDGNVSTIFVSKGNRDITWETNTNINAGVEFSAFAGRISGNVDYFDRKTTDMLFAFPVAPSNGYTSIYKNVGNMSNKGVEADVKIVLADSKNFGWTINANISYLKNNITYLDNGVKDSKAYDLDGNLYEGFSNSFFIAEGLPMYTWYTYETAGVDQATGKPLWYKNVFDETTGEWTGIEKTDDRSKASRFVTRKSTLAPIFGGFGTQFNIGCFDFAANFTYQIGGLQYDSTYATLMYAPTSSQIGYAYHTDLLNSWTPENPSSEIPAFKYGETYNNAASTRFLTSASYLNLQNVNVGFTLPERITKNFLVSSLRVYVSAENVHYWSTRKGFDPRQSFSSSASASNYSPMRTVSGGITVKF